MKKDLQQFLKTAIEAARAAGAIQIRSYEKKHRIGFKGEINLVTEVDKACEKKIIKIIRRDYPDHEILTEETGLIAGGGRFPSGARGGISESRWGARGESGIDPRYRWIVDPLDGTTNYAHGYPCFCVSIALLNQERPIVGVVYDPNLKNLFWAVKGGGPWRNKIRIRVSKERDLKRSLLATGFAYDVHKTRDDNIDHFTNFIKKAQAVRRDGAAAIDVCYVACGRYDGFWEMGLKAWDVVAAVLILEEAGGRSTMFSGDRLDIYGDNVVCSNGRIHRSMLKILRKRRK